MTEEFNANFSVASFHARSRYVLAHPASDMGDPNYSEERGYDLVAIRPDGLMVYRRRRRDVNLFWVVAPAVVVIAMIAVFVGTVAVLKAVGP